MRRAGRRGRPSGRRGCGHRGPRGPGQRPRAGARSRRCWPSVRSTNGSRRPGDAPTSASSSSPTTPATPTPSPRSSGFGADLVCPRLALQTVAAEADDSDDGDMVSSDAQERFRRRHRGRRAQDPLEDGHLDDRLVPGARRSSRSSASTPRSSTSASPAPPTRSAASAGTSSARTRSDATARPTAQDEPALDSPGYYRVRKGGEYHANGKEVTEALNVLTLSSETPPVSERDPQAVDQAAAHLLQRAIAGESYDKYTDFVRLVTERPPTELNDLLELVAARPADPPRRGRAGRRHRPTVLHRCHVARIALEGGPRDAGPGHEPHRRACRTAVRAARTPTGSTPGARAATTRTPASSRSRPAGSASPPSTWPTPTSSRSRWPRAPSPARAASSPATRCPPRSPACATPSPASG